MRPLKWRWLQAAVSSLVAAYLRLPLFVAGAAVQWLRDGLGMISRSSDGELIAKTVAKLGFPAVRGGAGEPGADKGGAHAFRETLRWLKGGNGIAITPDGPRGPSLSWTDGPVLLAKASGAQVLLCGMAARPCVRARSWDAHVVPLPFGRGAIAWDGPFTAPRDLDAQGVERLREDWRARLAAVTDRAEAMLT